LAKRTDKGSDRDWAGFTPTRLDTLSDEFARRLRSAPLEPGDILGGRFRLIQRLGDGAMGQVFVAENVTIGQKVAVKVLKSQLLTSASFRQRFQQEAEAIAAIDHPNVARFYDVVVGDPTFLVMEYVRGQTLQAELAKHGRLPSVRAARIGERLAWALEAAHGAGVIHRDIKPANVILAADAEHGDMPKLIDFGLAKLASQSEGEGLTRTGQIVGTPAYMAPEQIAARPVDARADVYALGCLLYEMVTGKPPFAGSDDVQVLYRQLHEVPAPMSKVVLDVDVRLEAVVRRALAKDPQARFASMRALAGALAGVGGAGVAPPPQRRLGVWAVGIVLVAALALGGGFLVGRREHPGAGLVLVTTPVGAKVELDGQLLPETTPTMARGLSPGAHTLKFSKQGTSSVERTVQLAAGARDAVQIVLPPARRKLSIESTPEGASVYLDGQLVAGETPTVAELPEEDFHEVRLERAGFETAVRALTPDDHEPILRVALVAEKVARATLLVDSPVAAEVWIDGVDTGYVTPTLGLRVPVGNHVVEVRDGGRAATTTVEASAGQTVRLLLTPRDKVPVVPKPDPRHTRPRGK